MCLTTVCEHTCSSSSHAHLVRNQPPTHTSTQQCPRLDIPFDAMSKPVAAAPSGDSNDNANNSRVHHSHAIAVPKAHALDVNDHPISAHPSSNDKCIDIEFGPMNDKYRILESLNKGSFGRVYSGVRVNTGEVVAIKAEDQGSGHEKIMKEANLCRKLQDCPGIPHVFWYGMHGSDYNFMVMERLGMNLLELFEQCNRKFSLTTVLKVTMAILPTLKYLHDKNVMHRDLSPRNIVIGWGEKKAQIYLIDFGLAKQCMRQGQMLVQSPTRYGGYCHPLVGTPRYASINSHRGNVIGRADDLESLGYVLVYFLKGQLPWEDEISYSVPDAIRHIEHMKIITSVEDLCKGVPDEFATLISYARLLRYYEMPDYKSITTLFRHLVENASIDLDEPYDWEKTDRSPDTGSPVLKLTRSKPSLPRIQAGSDDSISQFACSLCTTNSHSLCVSN